MTAHAKAALLLAGLAVVAGVSAPAATARPTCNETANKTLCQTNGSVSLKVRPSTVAPPGNMPHIQWTIGGARRR